MFSLRVVAQSNFPIDRMEYISESVTSYLFPISIKNDGLGEVREALTLLNHRRSCGKIISYRAR